LKRLPAGEYDLEVHHLGLSGKERFTWRDEPRPIGVVLKPAR
jgi:hypothetical protein